MNERCKIYNKEDNTHTHNDVEQLTKTLPKMGYADVNIFAANIIFCKRK